VSAALLAVLAALGAALSYASGAVFQQRAALPPVITGVGASRAAPPLRKVVRHPLWLFGVGLDGVGFLLEFAALRVGSVSLVQPLLVSGLLFALPLGATLTGQRIRGRDLAAGALVCVGLAVALLAARPGPGTGPAAGGAWLAGSAATGLVVGGLMYTARGRRPATRAVCFAASAGLVNGLFAGFAKAVGVRSEAGWTSVVVSWPLWALIVAAVLTLTLAAEAFRAGAPAAAVGALFAVEPVAGVSVGATLFGETVSRAPAAVVLEVAGVIACLLGVLLLSRSPAVVATYAGADTVGDHPAGTDVGAHTVLS